MKSSKTLDLIHAKIHGLRMLPKYKPSKFEQELNVLISKEFESECIECKNKLKALDLKAQLKEVEPEKKKESFLGGWME